MCVGVQRHNKKTKKKTGSSENIKKETKSPVKIKEVKSKTIY